MDNTEPDDAPQPASSARNMFDPTDEDEEAVRRLARRRIALIGVGTGAVMAVLMLLCVLLLYLATTSGP